MPIPEQRDAERTRRSLASWFAQALPADGPVELSEFRGPGATGFSNETLIVDVRWSSRGEPRERGFVVRVAPTGYTLFPDADFDLQPRVLRALAATPVPVPEVLFYERDPTVLGAPFYVMNEVVGLVPPDNPPYHVSGWLHDVSPAVRERVWWGAVDTIAEVHALDWRGLGLECLADTGEHAPGLPAQLAYYASFLDAVERVEPVPVARRALAWLRGNQPPQPDPLVLCWGDARIGNVLYSPQGERLAVLDWEMVSLGAPAQDLAWACFVDRHHSEALDVPRLEGFPSQQATLDRYAQRTGRAVADMEYYDVFAALRFTVIMARLAVIFKDWGLLPPDDPMAQDNTVSRLAEKVLAERGA